MSKIVQYGQEARDSIISGANKLAKAVSVTMGPQGRNVIISKFTGSPVVTKDGVSVAREFVLSDPVENIGCLLIKESAGRTAEIAGDGTTTTTVLASSILNFGDDFLKNNPNVNMLTFRNGLTFTLNLILDSLNDMSQEISTDEQLRNIAIISSNNDPDLGGVIADAFSAVGKLGMVTAEASPGVPNSFRIVDGIELPSGYISSHFLDPGQSKCVLENCAILMVNDEITHLSDQKAVDLFSGIASQNKSILIICKDLKKEGLAFFATNHKAGRLKASAIKIPPFGKRSNMWFDDLSMIVGATIVDEGVPLSQITSDYFGFAKKVEVSNFHTTITGPSKNMERINDRLKIYHEDLQKTIGEAEIRDIKNRIAYLSNKAAIITVGYNTELELREKGDRVEDATSAVKAALLDGYVPGGGFALLQSANKIRSKIPKEYALISDILIRACMQPCAQIIKNSGAEYDKIIQACIDGGSGYNSATYQYGDMIEMGIIDPKKVVANALKNALSIALLILTTESVLAENDKDPSGWQPPAGWRPPSQSNFNHKY